MSTRPEVMGDEHLAVSFYVKPRENPTRTREVGRPQFDDVEMVRIVAPGDRKRETHAPAHEMHYNAMAREQMTYAERFAPVYQAFKAGVADMVSGTPLDVAPFLTPAKRSELRALSILTVEQLAGLNDRTLKSLGAGGRLLQEEAERFIAASSGAADTMAMQAELETLRAQVASLTKAPAPEGDPFEGFEDDDLRNMIADAKGKVPPKSAGRPALVETLTELQREAEAA